MRLELVDGAPEVLGPSEGRLSTWLFPGGSQELTYSLCPQARGRFRFEATEYRVSGRLGLAQRRVLRVLADEIRVHPDLRVLRKGGLRSRRELLKRAGGRRTRSPGRDGDFERLRDFVAGDDLRHVDWKATARLQRPITRIYRSEKAQTLLLMVDAGVADLKTEQDVLKVTEKLRLDLSDEEAALYFQELISESVSSLFPQINETIHRWAQYWRS